MLFSSDQEAAAFAEEVRLPSNAPRCPAIYLSVIPFHDMVECLMHLVIFTLQSLDGTAAKAELCPRARLIAVRARASVMLAAQRGWEVRGGRVVFNGMEASASAAEVPAVDLINHALTYARELERIV